MTIDIERLGLRRTDVTVPSAEEEKADRRRAAVRADVRLKVTALTLAWAVSMAMLLGWSVAGKGPNDGSNAAAALIGIVFPFLCAVLGTRHRMPALGGTYVVITLLMALPAVWLLQS